MPKILRDIKLSELSLVTKGANQHSRIAITKSAEGVFEEQIFKYFVDSIDYSNTDYKASLDRYKDVFGQHLQQQAFYEAKEKLYCFIDALGDTIAATLADPSTSDDDKAAKVSLAVSDFLAYIKEEIPEITGDEDLVEIFEEMAEVPDPNSSSNIGKSDMTDKVDFEKMAKELEAKVADLVAKNDELSKMAALSDDEKTFIAKMTPEEKKKFMEASADEKKKQMDGVKKNDETLTVGGETISKSAVGDAQFAVFKRLAAAEERIAKAEETARMATFEKKASEEYSTLPGTPAAIAKCLDVIEKAGGEVAKTFESILKAAADANKEAFVAKGGKGSNTDGNDVFSQIDKLAVEIAARDKIGKAAAIAKAWEENPALYEQANS